MQQVGQREAPPPLAEAAIDHRRVALAGGDAEAGDHLLHEIRDRQQQQQHPQQAGAVLRAGLGVGGDGAGVVVSDHHDEARAGNDQEVQDALPPARATAGNRGRVGCERHPRRSFRPVGTGRDRRCASAASQSRPNSALNRTPALESGRPGNEVVAVVERVPHPSRNSCRASRASSGRCGTIFSSHAHASRPSSSSVQRQTRCGDSPKRASSVSVSIVR